MTEDAATTVRSSLIEEQMSASSLLNDEPLSRVPRENDNQRPNKRWFTDISDYLNEVKERKKILSPSPPISPNVTPVADSTQEQLKDKKNTEKKKKGKKVKINEVK